MADYIPLDVIRGISYFKQFGINLVPGNKVKSDGNCFISMVIDQINNRFVFFIKIILSPI